MANSSESASSLTAVDREKGKNLPEEDMSKWMANLPNEKQLCPLTQLTIPGSHDSASFWFDTSMELAPDQPKAVSSLSNVGFLDNTVKSIVSKWASTQTWNIKEQLCNGIRYFDLRVAYRKESDEFRFVHALYGHAVDDILEEIKMFLKKNPMEIVLLDFNHMYNMEMEEHLRLGSLIDQCFGSLLHSPRKDRSIASLQELWRAGEQVIVFYHNVSVIEMFPSFFSNVFITSQWPNTGDHDQVMEHVKAQGKASKPHGQYHVTQAISTPQTGTIVKNIRGSLKTSITCKVNKDILSLLSNSNIVLSFNILILDHVELDDLISTIIGLNYIY